MQHQKGLEKVSDSIYSVKDRGGKAQKGILSVCFDACIRSKNITLTDGMGLCFSSVVFIDIIFLL